MGKLVRAYQNVSQGVSRDCDGALQQPSLRAKGVAQSILIR
jgi:hypothetical protein